MEKWIYNIQFETKSEIPKEIKQKVMARYPKIDEESHCADQKRMRDAARECFARKIMQSEKV